MKIKFENNESNENDLFVKKSKTKGKKIKIKQTNKEDKWNNLAKKILFFLSIIFLITILIFFIFIKIGKEKNKIIKNEIYEKNKSIAFETKTIDLFNMSLIYYNKTISRKESLLKGRYYIQKCLNESLNKKYKKVENPIISVVIPVYNCEKTIII